MLYKISMFKHIHDRYFGKTDASAIITDDSDIMHVNALTYRYAGTDHGVHDVSFSVKKGEFFCLLGPSGCGKTTLLRLIAGLLKSQSGTIDIANANKHIGMVFQDLALFPHMTVSQNIAFGLNGLRRSDKTARIEKYLDMVGLSDHASKYPHELSGGQKQRLALARALAPEPSLILLDEPFASQDIYLRENLRDDVLHIIKESGVAALMVTHDPEEAMFMSDRMAIMKDGRMHQIGTPIDLYTKPKDDFVASLFGAVNQCAGTVEGDVINTCLGTIPAQDFEDGQKVQIIFRPEALQLETHMPDPNCPEKEKDHSHGLIKEVRLLRNATFVHMDICNEFGEDAGHHIHARVNGKFDHAGDRIQDIRLDHSKVFVFPIES